MADGMDLEGGLETGSADGARSGARSGDRDCLAPRSNVTLFLDATFELSDSGRGGSGCVLSGLIGGGGGMSRMSK